MKKYKTLTGVQSYSGQIDICGERGIIWTTCKLMKFVQKLQISLPENTFNIILIQKST
jgi:hypothetical protein